MAEDFVLGQGEKAAGSGATDLFGVIPPAKRGEPQAPEAEERAAPPRVHSVVFQSDAPRVEETDQLMDLLRAPVAAPDAPAQPVASPPSGGFTQLLRALNYEQGKKAAPVGAVEGGVRHEAAAVEAKPVGTPRVTSFQPPSAPPLMAAAAMEAREEPVAAPGSFTQLFRTLEAAPEGARVAEAPPAGEGTGPVADGGSFTKMLRMPVEQVKVEPPPSAASGRSGSFTRMFAAVSEAPVVAAPAPVTPPGAAVVPPAAPGSFTQVFRALDAAPSEADGATPAAGPIAGPVPGPVAPGSFTQMFSTPVAAPVEMEKAVPTAPAVAASAGSFTQMFQAVSESPKETAVSKPPAAGPSSFTQMFRALDAAPAAVPLPAFGSGQASPVVGAYRPEAEPSKAAPVFSQAPTPSLPQAPVASSGGLTQLLRALDQPGQPVPPLYPPAAAVPVQPPGSFTSVYGKLDAASPPFAPPVSAPVQTPAAPVQAGPSEFTRILNASMVREVALRGGEPQVAATPAPAPSDGPAAFAGLHGAPKMPEMPKVPKPEPLKLAAPKLPATDGMQRYVPLLLILVIFLLLAILVAVVFLMKK